MRSSLVIATVAAAAVAVSAEDCNPSYNVATSGTCFTNCNVNAGNSLLSGWTMDHTSSKFIASLTLMCNKGTSEYLAFMSKAGLCMTSCTDDPALFNTEFAGACAWWAIHQNDTCDGSASSTTASSTTASNTTASNTTTSSHSHGSSSASAGAHGAAESSSTDAKTADSTSAAHQASSNLQHLAIALAAGAAFFAL